MACCVFFISCLYGVDCFPPQSEITSAVLLVVELPMKRLGEVIMMDIEGIMDVVLHYG